MAETILKVVKVFIGSPSGLDDERQAAKRIVEEINQSHSEHWGCQIKLVGWEETLPGYRRAQSLINQDLDKCEYFVGVIWNHWGSKPDDGDSKYSSGFEEEFERARDRLEKGLMKDVVLYFKDIPDVQKNDPGASVNKVIDFRDKCVQERRLLFKQFTETCDFESLIRAKISDIGWQETQIRQVPPAETTESEQPAKSDEQGSSLDKTVEGLIGTSSARFVTDLLQRSSDWDETSPYEIARLRLVAASTQRSGNDELYLGNHDANLLFVKRNDFDFSDQEYQGLIDTGVAGFDHQNVPLWHWLACSSRMDDVFKRVRILAIIGGSDEKGNAIRILQCAGQGLPQIGEVFNRAKVIRRWLESERTSSEYVAALDFLKSNGNAEDLEVVAELLTSIPSDRKNDVAVTIIALTTSDSLANGFEMLVEYDPDSLAENVADQLFAHPESIPTQTLERCLTLKSDIVRKNAATLLNSREAINSNTAERLMTDSDPEVRLAAVESLIRQGQTLEEATIRKALTIQKPRNLLGILGGSDVYADSTYYDRYRRNQLSQISYNELKQKVFESDIVDHLELSILYHRFTGRCIDAIRNNLDDGFKQIFADNVGKLASKYGDDSHIVKNFINLEIYFRRILTSNALDALCVFGNSADLDLVRKTLDQHEVDFLQSALRFLSRFGDWADKERILAFIDRYGDNQSLLSRSLSVRANDISAALYAIGKSRLIDLLGLDADVIIRRALIAEMTQKDIRSLSDDVIITELNNDDDQFRILMALRCSQSLNQTRIRTLLDKYINNEGQRYYNSVHWLDLGASMPRKAVKTIAKFELSKFG